MAGKSSATASAGWARSGSAGDSFPLSDQEFGGQQRGGILAGLLREPLTERQDTALGQVQFHALNAMHGEEHDTGCESVAGLDGRNQIVKRNQINAANA